MLLMMTHAIHHTIRCSQETTKNMPIAILIKEGGENLVGSLDGIAGHTAAPLVAASDMSFRREFRTLGPSAGSRRLAVRACVGCVAYAIPAAKTSGNIWRMHPAISANV